MAIRRSVVALALVIMGGCGGSTQSATTTTEAERTSSSVVTLTTYIATAPAPTTTVPPTPAQQAEQFSASFELIRTKTAETLRTGSVQSVDRIEFDKSSGTVVLELTTEYSTEPYIRDKAWEITGVFLAFWRDTTGKLLPSGYSPAFRLVVNRIAYSCTGEFMHRLADYRATRDAWQAECAK